MVERMLVIGGIVREGSVLRARTAGSGARARPGLLCHLETSAGIAVGPSRRPASLDDVYLRHVGPPIRRRPSDTIALPVRGRFVATPALTTRAVRALSASPGTCGALVSQCVCCCWAAVQVDRRIPGFSAGRHLP